MESFNDVVLSDEEIKKILDAEKMSKFAEFQRAEKARLYQEHQKKLLTPFSAEDLARYVANKAIHDGLVKEIVLFKKYKMIFWQLACYFTNDSRFETNGLKLDKGLCLMGNIGTGKTTLMRMFSKNKRQCYRVISTRKVAGEFSDSGNSVIKQYSGLGRNAFGDSSCFLQEYYGYCFDDLGTENIKKIYGQSVNVMEEIILNRYDARDVGWNNTHITTNLTADEIESIYGSRVRSRMREMFNIIELTWNDLRK